MHRFLLATCLFANLAFAAPESRTWTSTSGNTLEATFVKSFGGSVMLKNAAGKSIKINLSKLSAEDQAYVRSLSGATPAPAGAAKVDVPNHTRHVRQKYTTGAGRIEIAKIKFKVLHTEHFVVLVDSGSAKDAADNAEAVWEEMHLFMPELKDTFVASSGQIPLIFVSDEYDYKHLTEWYIAELQQRGDNASAAKVAQVWPRVASADMRLGATEMDLLGVSNPRAVVFNEARGGSKSGKMSPLRTHVVSKQLLMRHAEGQTGLPFWLLHGFGYRMEIEMADLTVTHMIDYSQYESDYGGDDLGGNLVQSQHFADGSKWVSILRKMMKAKKGKKGNVRELMSMMDVSGLTPDRCGYMFAFSKFLLKDPESREKYRRMFEKAKSSRKTPGIDEVLEAYGYADMDALTEAWHAYMLGRDFR